MEKELLATFRQEIDALDQQIIDQLARRFSIIRRIVQVKLSHGIPAVLPDRIDEVLDQVMLRGRSHAFNPEFTRSLYKLIIDESCALESKLMGYSDDKTDH